MRSAKYDTVSEIVNPRTTNNNYCCGCEWVQSRAHFQRGSEAGFHEGGESEFTLEIFQLSEALTFKCAHPKSCAFLIFVSVLRTTPINV